MNLEIMMLKRSFQTFFADNTFLKIDDRNRVFGIFFDSFSSR